MLELTAALFDERVARGGAPALIEFWAPWCVYCRLLKPKVEQLGRQFGPALLVGRVDVVAEAALARAQGIEFVPGLAFFDGGRPVRTWYGDIDRREVAEFVAARVPPRPGQGP
jgi:thioredoxin-like negative regulator of GroEL